MAGAKPGSIFDRRQPEGAGRAGGRRRGCAGGSAKIKKCSDG